MQAADDAVPFSTLTDRIGTQICCGITRTIKPIIIQDSLHLSAVYSGRISGTGPRYCPSIEIRLPFR